MSKPYDCDKHDGQRGLTAPCPDCVEAFANRRDPDTMTREERASELRWWGHRLTMPFTDLHQRYSELVGRIVFDHEMASPERLIEEARTRQHPTPQEVFDQIPLEKRIIIVSDDD